MATKLYVGGLSFSTTSDSLREHFASFGEVVSATVVTERDSSRSRGFGFVEMASQQEAEAAIAALDQQPFEGRNLTVNIARSKTERPSRY